ncbi:tetratricopeptide repeat protein [Phormidesmis priestleyi ULC007]|uniref:Tetratricopeptide repeat protein n=1 Tax=Phormidesmis priestleyi ULC007 TaxID=1920490 RepID=A0A2T1DHN1_9CYAN|nr:tetratricopeptide repeat protein [Phormidesmis priestleyi]PSB19941.1 tetratricopeptide repeat protein [Phormidesmis priestleyi ULC007]PZO50362.1 MAG: tetratricopeptide repeat protein [Phormidesmis priestleyi]
MSESFYQQGIAKADAQDYQGALQAFDQAIATQPDFTEAYYNRGLARFKLNDLTGAITDYTTAIRLDANNTRFYFARSLTYLNQGVLQAAIADAEQVIRLNANHAGAYNLLGNLWQRKAQIGKAIVHYKKAAELYLEQKDAANCRRCMAIAQQLKPKSPDQLAQSSAPIEIGEFINQASDKARRGDFAGAIEDLDWAIQIDPDDAEAYAARGQVLEKMGNPDYASENYQLAARLFFQQGNSAMQQSMLKAIQQIKLPERRYTATNAPTSRQPPAVSSGRISPQVQDQLRRLVSYDRKIITDLVAQLKLKHPGRSEDWYWEKAIYDLERDRR